MATEAPPAVKPGLYPGLSYAEYDRIDAVRHSVLSLFNRTAAHAREAILHPDDSTEAQEIGTGTHLAILEPDRFDVECVAAPKIDKRFKDGKLEWAAFQAANAGRTLLTQDEYDGCKRMRDAVWAHPTARELLSGQGGNEVTAVWQDIDAGLMVKARMDRLTMLADWSVVVDLKTTPDAARRSFERDIYRWRYYQQASLYLDGCNAMAPRPRKFMFIAIEKDAPHCCAVYELDDDAINLGRDEYQAHLATYARCLETGRWPGYGDGADVISIPTWAFRAFPDGGE